jgi:flagellar biosynthetic protein FlhB
LFSSDNLAAAGLEGLKFTVVGLILYGGIHQVLQDPIFSLTTPLSYIGIFMEETFFSLMKRLILALGVLAALHYFYQRHKTYQNLRMSTQELKDEQRQSQLDPKLKAAQKRLALQLMQKQLLSQVPIADVVVTNPTHFAVAMKYERGKDKAPIVLAKGKNSLAQYIKKIAQEHGVPMTENKLAARLLYALGTVGKPIPVELYRIVADILSLVYKQHKYYFYRLKSRRSAHAAELNSAARR